MDAERRKTREIKVGRITVGGDSPISVQSMTNTDTHDFEATYRQVSALMKAGCDIVRLTVPDIEAAGIFRYLKEREITVPLVADIHFNHKIAIASAEGGADKIRINPGNIGSREGVRDVVRACRERRIPIRIGVNSGSVSRAILEKYGGVNAEALVESALEHTAILEDLDFQDIAISVKASDPVKMIEANRILSKKVNYPLHLGVTEAGGSRRAIVKSSIGIGTLLAEGIGDTIRVSLTDDPLSEVSLGRDILSSLGLFGGTLMDVVSCPTCGRTEIDLISLVREFEARASVMGLDRKGVRVAIMGCVVNGPGEAREADIGIAGGKGEGLLFKKGKILRKVSEDKIVDELIREIQTM